MEHKMCSAAVPDQVSHSILHRFTTSIVFCFLARLSRVIFSLALAARALALASHFFGIRKDSSPATRAGDASY